VPQGSFSAQVSAWVAEKKERRDAVYRESAQRVVEIMQEPVGAGGNLPVDTGFLRASLVANIGTETPALVGRPSDTGSYSYDAGQVNLVIAGAHADDIITVAYGANYARFQEYGVHGREGRRFVALAAQQWPRVVNEVCAEAQKGAGA
jgi:hypothetical protein